MRSMKVRIWRTVAGVAVLALGLAACGSDAEEGGDQAALAVEPAGEDEQVELTVWFGRAEFIPDDAFETFHDEHPNIRVNADVIPLEQIPADFIRVQDAGNTPDIIQPDSGDVGILSLRGLLLDITEILEIWEEEDPDLYNAMTDTAWDLASYQGVPYGLALHHGVYWANYRPDVLDDLGLDVPTTWDEVLEVGKVISEETDMYGYTLNASRDQTPEWDKAIFAQMGGQWVDGVMQIDSEVGHYWLNWYQRAMEDGVIDPDTIAYAWPDLIRNFSQGQAAMAIISRNVFVQDIAPDLDYGTEWLIRPEPWVKPGSEDDARYITQGWPYFVSAATEHPYEVGLVLRYLADDEQAFSVAERYQPVSNSRVMGSAEYLEGAPWGEDMLEPWDNLEVRPFHPNQAAMDEVIRDAMQEALTDTTADVEEMAARYQQQLDDLADEIPDPEAEEE